MQTNKELALKALSYLSVTEQSANGMANELEQGGIDFFYEVEENYSALKTLQNRRAFNTRKGLEKLAK
jgi:hypothetical protein